MEKTKITFVIPAFNRESLLKKTLKSLTKQTHVAVEIIVVDDYSEIPLSKTLKSYFSTVKFVRLSRNSGPSAARNNGINVASGEYVCFLDSDDLVDPEFSLQMTSLADKKSGAVICLANPLFSNNVPLLMRISHWSVNFIRNLVLLWYFYTNQQKLIPEAFFGTGLSRMVIPKKALKTVHFNEKMRNCEDWEFIIRLMKKTPIFVLPQALAIFRYDNKSLTNSERQKTGWKFYQKVIDMLPDGSKAHPLIKGFSLYRSIFSRL